MKRPLLFNCFMFLCIFTFAQDYVVKSVLELQNDLTARRKDVKDANGNGCALIRVNVPSVNDIQFEESIIGEPEYLPGEFSVFIPENSSSLSFEVNGTKCITDFSQFGITIEGKKCYRAVISKKTSTTGDRTKTIIKANYDNVVVLIDGVPVGQTPLITDNISIGKHILSIPNTLGVTMKDTTIIFSNDNNIFLTLHEEKKKPVNVDVGIGEGEMPPVWGYNIITKKNGKVVLFTDYIMSDDYEPDSGELGIMDYLGNLLVPCEFDNVDNNAIVEGCFKVENAHKKGVYMPGKGLIIPCAFDDIYHDDGNMFMPNEYMYVRKGDKYGVYSKEGEILPVEFDKIGFYDGYIRIDKGIERSLIKNDGTSVTLKDTKLGDFVDGYAVFIDSYDDRTEQGVVDTNGNKKRILSDYKLSNKIEGGLIPVFDLHKKKYGFVNKNLDWVIPSIYDAFDDSNNDPYFFNHEGISLVRFNEDAVIIDNKGNKIVSSSDYKDLTIVNQESLHGENTGFYSEFNNAFTPRGYVQQRPPILIEVTDGEDNEGLLDATGKVLVPCEYPLTDIHFSYPLPYHWIRSIQWFTYNHTDYFVLNDEKGTKVIDEEQNIILSLPLGMYVYCISDGFIMIIDKESGSYGYLNMQGEILANCIYGYDEDSELTKERYNSEQDEEEDYSYLYELMKTPISEGLAVICLGDRYGFIDNQGNVKVPMIYTAVTPFINGTAFVRDQERTWKKISKKDL